uniref:Uncharacterized protein n=1 Tax=viral metagenome TaxID=1070528 RepID=A0A6C0JWU5_9ZZZZ
MKNFIILCLIGYILVISYHDNPSNILDPINKLFSTITLLLLQSK